MLTDGKANNRFSRAGALSLAEAEWLSGLTGYRAGWLLWGELPEKPGASEAQAIEEARRAGVQQAYREIQEWAAARAAAATAPLAEAVPPVQAEQFFQEAEAALAGADRARKGKRRPA
jgi:hypothetical protein